MFDWNGCPPNLFDTYIEVGDVKKSDFESSDCVFIEIWIASHFSHICIREECKNQERVPIYGVLKQIKAMCGNKPACIVFMCDDMQNDTILWGEAVLLLQQELIKQKITKYSILYARDSEEETKNFVRSTNWHSHKSKESILSLLNTTDAVIYGQCNYYSEAESTYVHSKTGELPAVIKDYLANAKW